MHWLLTTHARRYQKLYRVSGHVWQGRFKAFPICEDDHRLAVLRYIERNPRRAGLVMRAEDWRWSSLRWRLQPLPLPFLHPGPVSRPGEWLDHVNRPQTEAELAAPRRCVVRGAPYGDAGWAQRMATSLGLEFTLRSPGRPRGSGEAVANPNMPAEPSLFDA